MVARELLLSVWASGVCSVGQAFVTPNVVAAVPGGGSFLSSHAAAAPRSRPPSSPASDSRRRDAPLMSTSTDLKELGLTPELERLTKVFRSCPTDKMRQMQLLHLAQMGDKMDPALQTEENKVLG